MAGIIQQKTDISLIPNGSENTVVIAVDLDGQLKLKYGGTVSTIGTGATGSMGPTGPVGATGPSGVPSATGPSGIQGTTGPSGATGPGGPSGIQGTTGSQGQQGIQGATGSQGQQGIQGATGSLGSYTYADVTASLVVASTTRLYFIEAESDVNLILPNPVDEAGGFYKFKRIDNLSNFNCMLVHTMSGSGKIEGEYETFQIETGMGIEIVSNGKVWYLI